MALDHTVVLATDWDDVALRVAVFVGDRLGPTASADDICDLTQECLRQVLDPNYRAFDPGLRSLEGFAVAVASSLVQSHLRKNSRWRSAGFEIQESLDEQPTTARPAPALLDNAVALKMLTETTRDDVDVRLLLAAMRHGFERPGDLDCLGLSPSALAAAKRRLRRAIRRVRDELAGPPPTKAVRRSGRARSTPPSSVHTNRR